MFGQEPPINLRSTTAVRRPDLAMCQARYLPPSPLPRTSISKCSGRDIFNSSSFGSERHADEHLDPREQVVRSRAVRMARWSDNPGVANLGHHARHHVVEIVTVKRPAAGIVGIKGNGNTAHWWHQDGIAHGTCEWDTVYRDHLESVTMKMHRVRHHRMVQHLDCDALARGDHQRGYVRPVFAVQ